MAQFVACVPLTMQGALVKFEIVPSALLVVFGNMIPYRHEPGMQTPLSVHAGPSLTSRITRKPKARL
jgi:hypothetical protein